MGTKGNTSVSDPFTGHPARFMFSAVDNRRIEGSFDYYEGTDNHVFLSPVPANLGLHYQGGYQPIPDTEPQLADMAKGDAYRLDIVKTFVPAGDFLEIGPWIGLVAYSAKQAGYRVAALEMTPECVSLMRRVGIDAVETDDPATTLADSGRTYDVIGLWHSIEHIPEPWRVIEAAARAVRPGGILLVAAPNPESAQFRVLKEKWWGLDAPRHLHLASLGFYERIGSDNGLETVVRTTDDKLGRIMDKAGWNWELQRKFRGIPILRSMIRLPLWRLLEKRHRRRGALDGSAFTLVMRRPSA